MRHFTWSMAVCLIVTILSGTGGQVAQAQASPPGSSTPADVLPTPDLPQDIQAYAQTDREAVDRHLLVREELQSQYALARQARQRDDANEVNFWVDQIRVTARVARQSPVPGAGAFGDYWLLQADLFSIRHRTMGLDARQREAIARLERFIRHQADPQLPPSDTRAALLRHTKLVLLGLYDHRGQSRQARQLYEQLLSSAPDLTESLADSFSHLNLIGEPVTFSVTTSRGQTWSLEHYHGQVVVLHFWSDWFEPSERLFDAVRATHERYRDQRVVMLSVNVLPQNTGMVGRAAWPTASLDEKALDQLHRLGVWTTPRLLVIDAQGRLAAIGSTPAVLEQVGPLVVDAHAAASRGQ